MSLSHSRLGTKEHIKGDVLLRLFGGRMPVGADDVSSLSFTVVLHCGGRLRRYLESFPLGG